MKKIINIKVAALSLVLVMFSCESLDTENNNNPGLDRILAQGTDLPAFLNGGYAAFWGGVTVWGNVNALNVTGDAIGMSWGNYSQRRMGEEPRDIYNNASSEAADYKQLVNDPWFGLNSAVSVANNVINALNNGVSIDDGGDADLALLSGAYMLRGISKGYMGLYFDKAFNVNEDTDVTQQLDFVPYDEMIGHAVADMQLGIDAANGASDDYVHGFWNGISLTKAQFIALSNSYAARFLAQWPRTAAENATADWAQVETRAKAGIDFHFAPMADGNLWVSYQNLMFFDTGAGDNTWSLVDQRLVAAMSNDPTYPSRYPEVVNEGEAPLPDLGRTTSDDARFKSDFVHIRYDNPVQPSTVKPWFAVDRGEWHYSWYAHNRNLSDPGFSGDGFSAGPMPVFRIDDNDLLLAEAHAMQTELAEAAAVINAGSRVVRGALPPVSADFDEIMDAVKYERSIEIMNTAPFSQWMDRRRWGPRVHHLAVEPFNGLQIGAPAHLPVPADELGALGLETYTFGGANDPNGIDPQ